MEHPSLGYFVEIAKCLNLSKAAEQLHVSQQSLSAYIQRLERMYNVPLLVRKPKMKLTEAGERLLLAAEEIENIYRELELDMQSMNQEDEFQLNVGVFIPLVSKVMAKFPFIAMNDRFPNISVKLRTGYNQDVERAVGNGNLDFGITTRKNQNGEVRELDPRLAFQRLGLDEECVVMTDRVMRLFFADEYDKYLEKFREGVDLLDLSQVPVIMHPMETGVSQVVRKYYMDNHRTLKVCGEGPTQEIVNSLILENNAYGFCSMRISEGFLNQNQRKIHVFPLKRPQLRRDILLIYRKDQENDTRLSEIREMIQKSLEDELEESLHVI